MIYYFSMVKVAALNRVEIRVRYDLYALFKNPECDADDIHGQ
jgi:hypothetical protein